MDNTNQTIAELINIYLTNLTIAELEDISKAHRANDTSFMNCTLQEQIKAGEHLTELIEESIKRARPETKERLKYILDQS